MEAFVAVSSFQPKAARTGQSIEGRFDRRACRLIGSPSISSITQKVASMDASFVCRLAWTCQADASSGQQPPPLVLAAGARTLL